MIFFLAENSIWLVSVGHFVEKKILNFSTKSVQTSCPMLVSKQINHKFETLFYNFLVASCELFSLFNANGNIHKKTTVIHEKSTLILPHDKANNQPIKKATTIIFIITWKFDLWFDQNRNVNKQNKTTNRFERPLKMYFKMNGRNAYDE